MAAPKQPLAFSLGEDRERQYIEHALAFANANANSDPMLRAHGKVLWDSSRARKTPIYQRFLTERYYEHLARKDLHAYRAAVSWLRSVHDTFRARIAVIETDLIAARRDLESELNKDLRRVKRHPILKAGILEESPFEISEVGQAGEVKIKQSWDDAVKPFSGELAYVAALLLDSRRPFGPALRQCKFGPCNDYFLSISRGGGPKPRYCCLEHTKEADSARAAKRMAELRALGRTRRQK